MTPHVSFYEVSLERGVLKARLGSGPADEIVERTQTDPCIRICLREPSDGSIEFRARFGVAQLAPDGLVDIPQNDPAQERGAWVQILPIGSRVWIALRHACGHGRLSPAISDGLTTGWLKVDGYVVEAANSLAARDALAAPAQIAQPGVFVRLGGTPEQITLALALLSELG